MRILKRHHTNKAKNLILKVFIVVLIFHVIHWGLKNKKSKYKEKLKFFDESFAFNLEIKSEDIKKIFYFIKKLYFYIKNYKADEIK